MADLDLHYRELGAGSPLVALHAGPGLDGSIFLPWLEPLATSHRLLLLDMPGHGRSGGGPGHWTLPGCAAAVAGFAEQLELGEYTLLGHSFGGFVALTHAVERPGHAARLVVSCSAATESALEGSEERMAALPPELRDQVAAAFEREWSVTTPEECRAVWADQLPFFLADPEAPLRDRLVEHWREVVYRPEVMHHEDWGDLDLVDALSSVETPMLVLAGARDLSTPPEASEQIARLCPRATLEIIADAGHFPFAERPEAYIGALREWLRYPLPDTVD